jgi:hypothetical protein
MFLDVLTTRGAAGLLLLLGFCGLAIRAARRRGRPELTAALVATLACLQFIGFTVATALYFFLLIALLVVEPGPGAPECGSAGWLVPVSVAASLLFAGFALRLLVADRALAVAHQRIQAGDAWGAAREYRIVLRWEPGGTGSDLGYARSMAQLATHSPIFATRLEAAQQSMEAAVRATRTAEDRQNAWYNLATVLAGQNDAAGVEHSLRNAIAWAPNWFKPHWTLARLLEVAHHHHEALKEAQFAMDLDGGRDPEVTETWKKLQSSDSQP